MVPYTGSGYSCWSMQMVECEDQKYYLMTICNAFTIFNPLDCENKSLLYDEKTGLYSPKKQRAFDAIFKNCQKSTIVGVHK